MKPKSLFEIVGDTVAYHLMGMVSSGLEDYFYRDVPSDGSVQQEKRQLERHFRGLNSGNIKERLGRKVLEFAENMQGARIGISFHDLKGRLENFDVNGDGLGWSASTIKVNYNFLIEMLE